MERARCTSRRKILQALRDLDCTAKTHRCATSSADGDDFLPESCPTRHDTPTKGPTRLHQPIQLEHDVDPIPVASNSGPKHFENQRSLRRLPEPINLTKLVRTDHARMALALAESTEQQSERSSSCSNMGPWQSLVLYQIYCVA